MESEELGQVNRNVMFTCGSRIDFWVQCNVGLAANLHLLARAKFSSVALWQAMCVKNR